MKRKTMYATWKGEEVEVDLSQTFAWEKDDSLGDGWSPMGDVKVEAVRFVSTPKEMADQLEEWTE